MLTGFQMPPAGFGPGSQPSEGELDYMALPSGMRTFEAHLPEIEDAAALAPALDLLRAVANACDGAARQGAGRSFPLGALDPANRRLIAETLGEGEVSAMLSGPHPQRAQESVFAGVWTVQPGGDARIEVAPVPRDIRARAFEAAAPAIGPLAPRPDGVVNGPALYSELMDRSLSWTGGEPHVINLSLLPHTPEDLEFLDRAVGRGSATLLSRGYGNCRVIATALPRVWRVRFFNSMDTLIVDTFEVTDMPQVVLAAREDFEDSATRLREVLEAIL